MAVEHLSLEQGVDGCYGISRDRCRYHDSSAVKRQVSQNIQLFQEQTNLKAVSIPSEQQAEASGSRSVGTGTLVDGSILGYFSSIS